MATTTIAHFSKLRALAFVIGGLLLVAIVLAVTLRHPAEISLIDYLAAKDVYVLPMVVIGWLAVSLLTVRLLLILRQILFEQARAIWIENGRVHYMNTRLDTVFRKLPLDRIESVKIEPMGRMRPLGIVMKLKAGDRRAVPIWILAESGDVVLDRLNRNLQAPSPR